jgi:hypothetical protein
VPVAAGAGGSLAVISRAKLVVVVLGLAGAAGAVAAGEPPRSRGGGFWLERTLPAEQRGTRDRDLYPTGARSTYDPAFLAAATTTVRTGPRGGVRLGLSGWTSQALPFPTPQGDTPFAVGDPAIGVSLMWEVPVEEGPPPPLPAGR